MAILFNSLFGQPSGKVGNLVFRRVRGKVIIASRPRHFKVSYSPALVKIRKNFTAAIKFATFINSLPVFKEIWTRPFMKTKSPVNRIFKINFPLVDNGEYTTENIITPVGVYLKINSLSFSKGMLNLSFTLSLYDQLEFPVELYAVLVFKGERIQFFALNKKISKPSDDSVYNVKLRMDYSTKAAFAYNPNPLVYFAVVGTKPGDERVYWTSTDSVQSVKK